MLGVFWDKVTGFTNEPVVQCEVPAVKNTTKNTTVKKHFPKESGHKGISLAPF